MFKATFNSVEASFNAGGKSNTQKNPITCHKSLTNFIT